uniref:GAG-pre-integrase domain-containing protein n=1 Tax=Fagus sylvatica TaxID=28930 RepID=A0A2N9HGS9_FAGSY
MESYLQGQDLWEIVAGSETTPPDNDQALRKWKVKAGKAMFTIKTSIEEEMLDHIRRVDTPKAAWDTFATLFLKKNNVRLQLLENELMSIAQRNMTITQYFTKPTKEEEMATASIMEEDKEMALAVANPEQVNYREDWIVDSGCSNHMTGDKEKLQNMSKYKGKRVVVTVDNTRLPIAHIGETLIIPRFNTKQVPLEQVYHVPGVNKNLLSVAQQADSGNWVLFVPKDVKVYKEIVVIGTPTMEGQQMESVYVMSAESAYVDKTRKNETVDLWHARLGHVSYHKLKESKFRAKEPLELVHSDVFGRVKQPSIKGMRYMVTFIDDFSRCGTLNQRKVTFEFLAMSAMYLCLDHLRSKFDKKAIRCIFVGYDSQRKVWRCCDPTTGRCYTSRNVIFDEASSWWSEDKATLPVLKEIEEKMPESMEEQSGKDQSKVIEEIQFFEDEGEPESSEITQNP